MLKTELRHHGDRVDFAVATDDVLCRDRLLKMGWQEGHAGWFSRRLAATGDVERIFARFQAHLDLMIRQSARQAPVDWETGLAEFVDRVEGSGLAWWLYGSGALAVRGIDIQPGDLDLAVDDPWLAGRLMDDLLVEPVTDMTGWIADAGGRAFHGALIEWIAGVHPTGIVPPHEQEPAAAALLETVEWQGRPIPVPPLGLALGVADRRGQADRVRLIWLAMAG